jgi:glycogen debranching enzyme
MPALDEQLVLKEGDIFFLSRENGDVDGGAGQGMYYRDTRYLSLFTFRVNGQSPPLLNSSSAQNFMGTLQLANDIYQLPDGTVVLPQTLSIRRSRFISGGLHERIGLANFNRFPLPVSVTLQFGSDFRDIFDVRGFPREKWGELQPPLWEDGRLVLRYLGIDGLERTTEITFDRAPDSVDIQMPANANPVIEPGIMVPVVGAPTNHIIIEPPVATLTWNLVLEPNAPVGLSLNARPGHDDAQAPEAVFDGAVNYMRSSYGNWETQSSRFSTDDDDFNRLLRRSQADLRVLCAPDVDGEGYFPSAGIPWYACPFGRDSLITATQTLSFNPGIAVGTLRTLARYQGEREDPWREEQPGKILHELRMGEMARLGMVPHSPYYGTVDATPLFVLLFVEAMRWLDSDALYHELLPNDMRAVELIDK